MNKITWENNIVHPCFNHEMKHMVRIHIPLTQKCNINCLYCNRKVGCINENRPGVSERILSTDEIVDYCCELKKKYNNKMAIIGFSGPGEVLAEFEKLQEVISILKSNFNVEICLATNGLLLPFYAKEILDLDIKYITVTVNAVSTDTAMKIYSSIKYQNQEFYGKEAVEILLENQIMGIKEICESGIICKINTVAIKNVNVHEINEIMKIGKDAGAYIGNVIPLLLVENTKFYESNVPDKNELCSIRNKANEYLSQMKHCKQCRADAVGNLV